MRGRFQARRLAVIVWAVVMLGASAGSAASDVRSVAVPSPPSLVCNTHGPYYDHLEPVV